MTLAQTISAPLHRPLPRRWIAAAGFAVLAMAAVALWGSGYANRLYFDEAHARGNNTLRLAVAVLRGHMERYESLPRVIADFDDIKAVVADPGNQDLVADVNAYLKQINTQFESSDIYVMGEDGTTIVASNYDSEAPFVGENFQYRPISTTQSTAERVDSLPLHHIVQAGLLFRRPGSGRWGVQGRRGGQGRRRFH